MRYLKSSAWNPSMDRIASTIPLSDPRFAFAKALVVLMSQPFTGV
jgi:hypothetical protein